jgi:beta-lactamase regulating signal transducer with metallopeptidase domain
MMWLLEITARMSLVLALGLAAVLLMRQRSAALRHWVIAATIVCAGSIPVLGLVAPSWTVPQGPAVVRRPAVEMTARTGDAPKGSVLPSTNQTARLPAPTLDRLAAAVVPVWLLGVVANLLVLLVAMFRLTHVAGRAAPVRAPSWNESLVHVSERLTVRRTVLLLQSDRPALLVTWGLVSPRVLLPSGASAWSDERIRIVLAHELAHVARGDWLVQIAAEVVRCVYWFNPLLWIACTRLRQESEYACDDAVMNVGIEGGSYATHLLELARTFGKHRRTWLPVPAMAGRPSTLERRISAMLNSRLNRAPLTRSSRWVWAAALLAVTLPIAAFAQSSFGSVSGIVVDQMDRVLPGAMITVTDSQRNVKHEVRTDRDGRFELVGLPAGPYAIETKLAGFQPRTGTFAVNGQPIEWNLKLEIGALQETIRVTGGSTPNIRSPRVTTAAPRPIRPCAAVASAVGGNIRPPGKIRDVRPEYPGVEGHINLEARIATDGSVAEVRVVKSDRPELESPAIAAVSQWQFTQTLLNCVPVEVKMNVDVDFRSEP